MFYCVQGIQFLRDVWHVSSNLQVMSAPASTRHSDDENANLERANPTGKLNKSPGIPIKVSYHIFLYLVEFSYFCFPIRKHSDIDEPSMHIVIHWTFFKLEVVSEALRFLLQDFCCEKFMNLNRVWKANIVFSETPLHLYSCVFTNIYTLLIEKYICDCRKISFKLMFTCLFYLEISSFFR